MEITELRIPATQLGIKLSPRISGACNQAANLKPRKLMVSEGMRTAHMAGTDAKDTDGGKAHRSTSITLPPPASSRESFRIDNYSTD